jgi:hypothetical protein
MKNRRTTQNIINIIVFLICLFIILIGANITSRISVIKTNIYISNENEWREQAKRTLSNLQNQFMYDYRHGVVNPYDELSLNNWSKRNLSGVLNGGETGDAFMINLGDEKFIWDGSPDCSRPEFIKNGRYLKNEPNMHHDKKQAQYIINKMRLGQNTTDTYEKYWWNFDGSPEYLEWVVIPPGALGFNDESITNGGVRNTNYTKILIALGTQQDEIRSNYTTTINQLDWINAKIKIFISMCVIICMINMIIYVYINKKI